MLTIIRCKDCGETMAYECKESRWKCAKCGKSNPIVLPMPHRQALKVKKAKEKTFA
jgi:DNA-directed RNA polymerase subunit M/transcription elongation factor TFIIS